MAKRSNPKKWPLYINLPGEGEFCTGYWRKGNCCCLEGWALVSFGYQVDDMSEGPEEWEPNPYPDMENKRTPIGAFWASMSTIVEGMGYANVAEFNDAAETTDADRAVVFALAAAEHRYTPVAE